MSNISRRSFVKFTGTGLLSAASLALAGCGGSSGSGDAAGDASGEAWGEGATLRVGSDCDYAPHSWIQTDDSNGAIALSDGSGYVGGYDTKIAQIIGDTYNWNVTFIKVDWDGLIPALNAGKIDCIIDGMGVTEERKQSVDFSDYYWSSDQGILLMADSPFAGGTSLEDFVLYLKAELLDAAYLQQDSFNDVDAACSAERQRHVFGVLCEVLDAPMSFPSQDEARAFFHRLTQTMRDWNVAKWDTDAFRAGEAKIREAVEAVRTRA